MLVLLTMVLPLMEPLNTDMALTVLLLIMVLEPGVLMVKPLMLVNGPVPGMELTLLTMPLSVITDMAPTVLGEPPPTLVPGPATGLALMVLPHMLEKVSGTPLLMPGLVLSTLLPPTVLMTGPCW